MLAGQGQSVCTKVTFFLFNLGAKKLIFTSKSRKILRNGPFGGRQWPKPCMHNKHWVIITKTCLVKGSFC